MNQIEWVKATERQLHKSTQLARYYKLITDSKINGSQKSQGVVSPFVNWQEIYLNECKMCKKKKA